MKRCASLVRLIERRSYYLVVCVLISESILKKQLACFSALLCSTLASVHDPLWPNLALATVLAHLVDAPEHGVALSHCLLAHPGCPFVELLSLEPVVVASCLKALDLFLKLFVLILQTAALLEHLVRELNGRVHEGKALKRSLVVALLD